MGSTPQEIRAEIHSEIGLILQQDASILVERWCRRAIEEQPGAGRAHHEALLDHLPSFLDALGRSLVETEADGSTHKRPAADHGEQRWELGWSLPEVVRDYQILRLVIIDYLEEILDRPLAYREVMAIGLALDDAISASVLQFVASRDEYLRQLEQTRADETRKVQETLAQREEALREADSRKNEFLATLAHEIRNLLAPLRNVVGVLSLYPAADATLQQVHDISAKQVQVMTRLLDDLLDITRIAQGKIQLRKERLALASILAQAAEVSESLLKSRRHQLTVTLPPEPLWLDGDQARLVQIVVNLLNNAAKYTNPGGEVRLEAARDGADAVVRVRDNGIGIAPQILPYIFDLFTQAEWSVDRSQGGLGIGLTLVKRLVELHGGTIAAHSAGLGQGSEFVVRVPLAVDAGPVESAPPQAVDGRTAARHVLIIEDNADGRESLALLLRLLGHRVDVAENGLKGVEQALASRPEVALIDLLLPDLDGCQVARSLRSSLAREILLVALTGSSQPEDRQRTQEAGFDAHLTKPVELDELQKILRRPS